jgi:hypothetical protein
VNFRHSVALALVGWYLMCAPRVSDSPLSFDSSAPLSRWSMSGSYDTASECRQGKDDLLKPLLETVQQAQSQGDKTKFSQMLFAMMDALQCFSTDDPRLKE